LSDGILDSRDASSATRDDDMAKLTALTDEEKRVIKALLADGMRNQDIHTLVNHERKATINFGRIAGVKNNLNISPASAEEVAFFKRKKRSSKN